MRRIFDAYLMVDWSANSTPKVGKDSVWVAWGSWGEGARLGAIRSENPPTRHDAVRRIRQLLIGFLERDLRALVGFDFPLGYPRGFAAALAGPPEVPAWRFTWEHWDSKIKDRPDNGNNRFAVAAAANRRLSGADHPFWGCPPSQVSEYLSARALTRRPPPPAAAGLVECRFTEERLRRARFGSIQSVWKLLYTGSVGSQALVGIPRVRQLRLDPRLAAQSAVWPFETGFTSQLAEARIVHAEIWPGILKRRYAEKGRVVDEAQVRSLVRAFADLDDQGRLGAELEAPEGFSTEQLRQIVGEEGWILGSNHAVTHAVTARGPTHFPRSPKTGDQALGRPPVGGVFVAELFQHHPLLVAQAEGEEDAEGDQVRGAGDPVGQGQQLAHGAQAQGRVHRVAQAAVDTRRDEPVVLPDLQGDGPVRPEIGMGAME
jgi:hypothetical protein